MPAVRCAARSRRPESRPAVVVRATRPGSPFAAPPGSPRAIRRSPAMKRFQNFVDGQLVDALSGESETIASPASEQAIASVPKAGAADVDRAVAAADRAFAGWSDQTPGRARRRAAETRRPGRIAWRRTGRDRERQRRQADVAGQVRDPLRRRQPALLRRRRALPRRQGRRRVPRRLHQHDPARAGRRGRLDRAVELPADDGGVEDRPGAGHRQHGGAQARRADPADLAAPGRTGRRHLPARRVQRDHRPWRTRGRVAGAPSQGRHGLAHRRRGHRQDHREVGLGFAQARAPGTRRQGSGAWCSTTPTSRSSPR